MSGSSSTTLFEELSDKEYRDAYAARHITTGIAQQIRALREQRGWSQAELGQRVGKPQSVISRLENPRYGKLNLQTLLELASAFDVALFVRFVSFSDLLRLTRNLSPEALAATAFEHDRSLLAAAADRYRAIEALTAQETLSRSLAVPSYPEDQLHLARQPSTEPFTAARRSAASDAQIRFVPRGALSAAKPTPQTAAIDRGVAGRSTQFAPAPAGEMLQETRVGRFGRYAFDLLGRSRQIDPLSEKLGIRYGTN